MANEQAKEEKPWYVMRAYKNERKAEERLSGEHGLEFFVPKQQVLRTYNGKKIRCLVPVISSLIFVHATQQEIIAFKKDLYNDLQFVVWKREGEQPYLTVPAKQMKSFIEVCRQKEKVVTFYKPEEIQLDKGQKVRVHGGTFDNVEGYFVKVARRRSRQLVVIIPEVLAASTEIDPDYLEIID